MREKAQRAKRNGVTLQDQVLGEPQLLGQMTAGPMAPHRELREREPPRPQGQ